MQVGLATDKAQYIHRLGRTARAGKSGKGMLLLGDFEERFLGSLSELPLVEAAPLPAGALAEAQAQVQQGLAAVDEEDKSQVSRTSTYCAHALEKATDQCAHLAWYDVRVMMLTESLVIADCMVFAPCTQSKGLLLLGHLIRPAHLHHPPLSALLTESVSPCRHTAHGLASTRAP